MAAASPPLAGLFTGSLLSQVPNAVWQMCACASMHEHDFLCHNSRLTGSEEKERSEPGPPGGTLPPSGG